MKTLIVYFSQFGNTRRIAEAIAETLMQTGETRAVSIDQFTASDLSDVDLVVMGSPTHYQNLPKAYRKILEKLPKRVLQGKSVAAFDTSLKMWGPIMLLTAAHRLLSKLRKLVGKRIARPETFLVKDTEQQPDGEVDLLCNGEIERAREWANLFSKQMR
jgi:flavodoxin